MKIRDHGIDDAPLITGIDKQIGIAVKGDHRTPRANTADLIRMSRITPGAEDSGGLQCADAGGADGDHSAAALAAQGATAQTSSNESHSVNESTPSQPPEAEKRPHSYTFHGITVEDPYAWLRDPGYPDVDDADVIAHLNAENAWFEARMAAQQPVIDTLFAEMRARIKEADSSVPQKDGDWLYWTEFEEGAEYRKWYRRPVAGGDAQLILDEPALAQGKEYFRLGAMSVSNDGRLLAYSIDDNGSERFTMRIKDLTTGEHLPDEIPGTLSSLIWVAGDTGLVHSLANEQWRTDNARLHWLGRPLEEDLELQALPEDFSVQTSVELSVPGCVASRHLLILQRAA